MTQQTGSQDPPYVTRVHKGRFLARPGRGFSIPELRQAGITINHARTLEVHVDPRRKTAHVGNIDLLKAMAKEVVSATRKSHEDGE